MVTFTPKGLILPDPPTVIAHNLCTDPFLRDTVFNLQNSSGVVTEVLIGGPNGNGYLEYDMAVANTLSPIAFNANSGVGNRIPVVAGQTYNVSGWWFKDIVDSRISRFDVAWFNAAGALISTTTSGDLGNVVGDFVRKSAVFVAPANAVSCTPGFVWSGAFSNLPTLRMADIQVSEGPDLKPFTPTRITLEDGDPVDVGQINSNLDRTALMGIGARPLLSSERPAFESIDDMPGTIIFETDTNGIWVRREGTAFGNFIEAEYRAVAPGNWMPWNTNNPFTWLHGDNNYKHARVTMLGRLIFVHMEMRIGTGGTINAAAGILPVQLPTNRDSQVESGFGGDSIGTIWPVGQAMANIGGSLYTGRIVMDGGQPRVRTVPTNHTAVGSPWNETTPAVWAPGDGATFDYMYWSS